MPSKLAQLRQRTTIVADTADARLLRDWQPTDCTTNPSLMLRSLDAPESVALVAEAWSHAGKAPTAEERVRSAARRYAVLVARDVLRTIPGLVSVEVDARLAHDADATVAEAHAILREADDLGLPRSRILIKVAATWAGIEAARGLQAEGINCNLTLVFSLAQAQAASEAGAYLISPFVGRVTDWHRAHPDVARSHLGDPGVDFVLSVRATLKELQSPTIVMAASFRKLEQIEALAGCPKLTISPALLGELANDMDAMSAEAPLPQPVLEAAPRTAEEFQAALKADAMAHENLASGLQRFMADTVALDANLTAAMRGGVAESVAVGR